MDKEKSRKIRFQESGGGWGNPLMGLVFDSDKDVPDEELSDLVELLEQCDISESGELPGTPPADASTFELQIEEENRTIRLIGDMQRADDRLRSLVGFIREHSRKEMLE